MNERVVASRKLTAEETALDEWFLKQSFASPDNLEAAARLLIGLITGLLGTLLGVLSLSDDSGPEFLDSHAVLTFAAIGVLTLLIALWLAIWVVVPLRMNNPSGVLDEQRQAFAALVQRKARFLSAAILTFAVALTALAIVLAFALFG